MEMRGSVLNGREIERIHDDSIRILEEVGVKVPSEQILTLLEAGGAQVDWDGQIARISGQMVEEALKSAPAQFTLGARNPKFDLELPSADTTLNMDGCGSNTIDFQTGKRRLALLRDLEDAAKVFDAIPSASVLWSCVMPSDAPSGGAGVISSAVSMLNSGKHLQDEIQSIRELPYIIQLCKAFLGSEEEVIRRKIYSATYCTVAPLCHDGEMLEGTAALTKYKAPVLLYPMPACGSTGPASLYSNVALANAESLSSLVIFQLAAPGTPLIYGSALGRINIRTGTFLEGAAETELMMAAMVQMGKHYRLPTIAAGCLSDANEPGIQSAMEKTLTTLPLILAQADVIQGIGLLESSMTLSLEQMLIDEEIFNQCRRMGAGIQVCDEKNYFEDIATVAQGGHYLKQKTTRRAFRSDEFYNSRLIISDTYDTWLSGGSKSIFDKAHQQVRQILDADPISPVDQNTENVVREIMEEAGAKL
ncbi:MAG: trimethylamine methyltransferase family protein [Clostridiales Family XIII bacterium]|nr:trimethylamine methyltransferase family protein [Clostridia bacterium]MDY3009640.1 trimethylamine methyltransferase family protein [Clostridiales Family XIII bacterium]